MTHYEVKITSSLLLEISFERGKIVSAKVRARGNGEEEKNPPEWLLELFKPYIEGTGDPPIDMGMLETGRISDELLKILLTLRKEVPLGKLITYKELGLLAGKHPRVIGMAMKRNPFPVILPCHRVVAVKGMGGYSQGKDIKALLIAHERGHFPNFQPF